MLMRLLLAAPPVRGRFSGISHELSALDVVSLTAEDALSCEERCHHERCVSQRALHDYILDSTQFAGEGFWPITRL